MGKFVVIGERLSTTAPIINKALPEEIRSRFCREQNSSWMQALPIWMLISDRQRATAKI